MEYYNESTDKHSPCGGYKNHILVISFLILVVAIGVIGNSLVFLTSTIQSKRTSCSQFIIHLAFYDMTACLTTIPVILVGLIHNHTIPYNIVCKLYMFLSLLLGLSSLTTLDFVAIDRYLKICRPFSYGISYEASKRLFVLELITGLVFALATLFLSGLEHAELSPTSTFCYRGICLLDNDFYKSEYRFVFNIMMFIVLTTMFLVLTLSYILIIKSLYKRHSGFPSSPLPVNVTEPISSQDKGYQNICLKEDKLPLTGEQQDKCVIQTSCLNVGTASDMNCTPEEDRSLSQASFNKKANDVKNTCLKIEPKTSNRRQTSATKSAKILFVVTISFMICWLPSWLLGTFVRIKVKSGEHLLELSANQQTAMMFFEYWYLTNHAVNPVIYAFMDQTFRKQCLYLLRLRSRTSTDLQLD